MGPTLALRGKADDGSAVLPVGVPSHGLVCCERAASEAAPDGLREWTLPGACGRAPYQDVEAIAPAAACDVRGLPPGRAGMSYRNFLEQETGETTISEAEGNEITFWGRLEVAEAVCERAEAGALRLLSDRVAAHEAECAGLGGTLTTQDNVSTSDCVVAPDRATVQVFFSASCEYR
jgi:hypothetical protein